MTPLEISELLARAIGWKDIILFGNKIWVRGNVRTFSSNQKGYEIFDHMDWAVAGPIAERYDCFPTQNIWGGWHSSYHQCAGTVQAFTLQRAIAMAVIQGAKK
jgi:hypothetical protein